MQALRIMDCVVSCTGTCFQWCRSNDAGDGEDLESFHDQAMQPRELVTNQPAPFNPWDSPRVPGQTFEMRGMRRQAGYGSHRQPVRSALRHELVNHSNGEAPGSSMQANNGYSTINGDEPVDEEEERGYASLGSHSSKLTRQLSVNPYTGERILPAKLSSESAPAPRVSGEIDIGDSRPEGSLLGGRGADDGENEIGRVEHEAFPVVDSEDQEGLIKSTAPSDDEHGGLPSQGGRGRGQSLASRIRSSSSMSHSKTVKKDRPASLLKRAMSKASSSKSAAPSNSSDKSKSGSSTLSKIKRKLTPGQQL